MYVRVCVCACIRFYVDMITKTYALAHIQAYATINKTFKGIMLATNDDNLNSF